MELTKTDANYLYELYKLRCLTLKQSFEFFYFQKYENERTLYEKKIVPLLESNLIILDKGKEDYVFKLSQQGINFLKETFNIPSEIYDFGSNKIIKGYKTSGDLELKPNFYNHQINLNQFVLEFETMFHDEHQYYDETYIENMSMIRPDGVIRIGNIDLFLEQDMGTESYKQLLDKWQKYRRYLVNEFAHERKINVLFILKCAQGQLQQRKDLVRKSIMNSFPNDNIFGSTFDIYVGTKEEMLDTIFNWILKGQRETTAALRAVLTKSKFSVNDGSKLKSKMAGSVHHYYLACFVDGKLAYYNALQRPKGRYQEFLADTYKYQPMSVLSKIAFHNKNSHNFDLAYSAKKANVRLIGYMVILDDIHKTYHDLKTLGLDRVGNVYFTTFERLENFPLPKALFCFDESGNIMSCLNGYYEATINEGNISEFNEKGLKTNTGTPKK